MLGFETILPFLRPIEHLILDDTISEVMVNGGRSGLHRAIRRPSRSPRPEVERKVSDGRRQKHRQAAWGRHLGTETYPRLPAT